MKCQCMDTYITKSSKLYKTGDIILASKDSLVVKFMNLFQKDPCTWGHVMLVKDEETIIEAYFWLRETSLQKRLSKIKYYKVIRKKDLTEEQKQKMIKYAEKLLGKPYGVFRIILQMFDQIFNTNWFTRRVNDKYLQVCSSYIAWAYWCACRYKFNGVHWASCDPDDIEDDQLAHPERWEVLIENRRI